MLLLASRRQPPHTGPAKHPLKAQDMSQESQDRARLPCPLRERTGAHRCVDDEAAAEPGRGCGRLLLPPALAFLSKAWQRPTLSALVSSRENLARNCGSVLLK